MRGSSRMPLAAEAVCCWENRVLEGMQERGSLGIWLPGGVIPITGAGLAGGLLALFPWVWPLTSPLPPASATTAGSSGSGGMASVCTNPRSPRTRTSCPRRMSFPSSRRTAPEGLGRACPTPCPSEPGLEGSAPPAPLKSSVGAFTGHTFLLWDTLNFPPWSAAWELSALARQDCQLLQQVEVRAPGASGGCVGGSRALPFSPRAHTHFSEFCALPEGARAPALPSFLLGKP